jgi:steroid delta-isomerase-like uncharacterized protein
MEGTTLPCFNQNLQPMRVPVTILLVSICLVRCSTPENTMEVIARARVATMNKHDLQGLSQLFADSAKVESVGFDVARKGPAGVREAYTRYWNTSPDMTYALTSIVAGDHDVVVEYTSVGTMNSPEKGEPEYMRGKKYTLRNCTRMTIENGKIIREMTYFDQLAFLRQVGFFEHQGN